MVSKLFLVAFSIIALGTFAGADIIQILDNFQNPTSCPPSGSAACVTLSYPSGGAPAVTGSAIADDIGILGGERDLLLRVYGTSAGTGDSNARFGRWQINTSPNLFADAEMQYDGNDNSVVFNPSTSGFAVNMLLGGANSLYINYTSDGLWYCDFQFYSSASSFYHFNYSSLVVPNPGDEAQDSIPYSSFISTGSPSWSNIVAMRFQYHARTLTIDTTFYTLATFGNQLSGTVFIDCDQDGTLDPSPEEGDCVRLTLTDRTDFSVQNTVSDCFTGDFLFGIIADGRDYDLCLQIPTTPSTIFGVVFPVPPTITLTSTQACYRITTIPGNSVFDRDFGILYNLNISIPLPTSVACTPATLRDPANTGFATVSDYCGPDTTTYSDNSNPQCGIIQRTWRQTTTLVVLGTQSITITDSVPPQVFLSIPNPAPVSCFDYNNNPNILAPGSATAGTATASDVCNGLRTASPRPDSVLSTGCTRTFSRTWEASDGCGNTGVATQIFSITDSTPPTLIVPGPSSIPCGSSTAATAGGAGTASATDDCTAGAIPVTVGNGGLSALSPSCSQTFIRSFTATDGCNPVTLTQLITITDTSGPVQQGTIIASTSISCSQYNSGGGTTGAYAGILQNPTWTDCQTITTGVSNTPLSPADTCNSTWRRTFSAQDACGQSNAVPTSTLVTVTDTQAPLFTPPTVPAGLECSQRTATTVTTPVIPSSTDNCQSNALNVVTYSDATFGATSNPFGCTSTFLRTWQSRDTCGNTATVTQLFSFEDNVAPVVSFVNGPNQNTVIDCALTPGSVATAATTATDFCNTPVFFSSGDNVNGGPGPIGTCGVGTIRHITYTDGCSNFGQITYRIDFQDTVAPTLFIPADIQLECPASTLNPTAGVYATATDACATPPFVTYDDSTFDVCNPTSFPLRRTWTAADNCNNVSTFTQTITYRDTAAPVMSVTSYQTQCSDTSVPTAATALDACSGSRSVTITSDNNRPAIPFANGSTCTYTRQINYQASDSCGTTATTVQFVTYVDTTQPTLNVPSFPTTVDCLTNTAAGAGNPLGTASSTDACHTPSITLVSTVATNTLTCATVYERTWTTTDGCTATVTGTQTFTVADSIIPTFDLPFPGTLTYDCEAFEAGTYPSPAVLSSTASATDACGATVTITFEDTIPATPHCTGSSSIVRTWTAADACGSTSRTQAIHIVDNEQPSLFLPPNVTDGDCTDLLSDVSFTGTATASDNCNGVPTIALNPQDSTTGTCTLTTIRTFRATDACGNFATQTQSIVRTDTTPPTLFPPGGQTVTCGDWNLQIGLQSATATDDCNGPTTPTLVGTPTLVSTPGLCPEIYQRVFTTVDSPCNHVVTGSQLVTVTDTIPPFFTNFPADRNNLQACNYDITTAAVGSPTPRDDCHGTTGLTFTDSLTFAIGGIPSCGFTQARTWTVSDTCGNPFTQTQVFTIRDTAIPTISTTGIADTTVPCDAPLPVPSPTATDAFNCNNLNLPITYFDTPYNRAVCDFGINRTFRVSDVCGNAAIEYVQEIARDDSLAPSFDTFPPSVTFLCTESDNPFVNNALGVPTISDTCDPNPTLTYRDAVTDAILCPDGIERDRTWIAEDACDNRNVQTQQLTIILTEPPTLIIPPGISIECDDAVSLDPSRTGQATATSPCLDDSDITITYSDVTNGLICPETISRTWTASDLCGNRNVDTQNIFIDDTTDPTWAYFPPNRDILCGAADLHPSTQGFPIAVDNCVFPVCDITWRDFITFRPDGPGTCPGDEIVERTWTATDECGNFIADIQTLVVLFGDPASDCPPEPCPARPCELCECPLVECDCCAAGGVTACESVPCTPVACTPVNCLPVDCIACPVQDTGLVNTLPTCGPEIPCIPNIIPQFVDDDDYQYVDQPGNSVDSELRDYWRDKADYWRNQAGLPQQGDTSSIAPFVALIVLLVTLPLTVFLNLN